MERIAPKVEIIAADIPALQVTISANRQCPPQVRPEIGLVSFRYRAPQPTRCER